MSGTTPTDSTKPCRGRRISWDEFEKLTGRKRPDYDAKTASNDNLAKEVAA